MTGGDKPILKSGEAPPKEKEASNQVSLREHKESVILKIRTFYQLRHIAVMDNYNRHVQEIIEACRLLIKTLGDPNRLPLEREAGYLLAQALHLQVEKLGLLEAPELQEFLNLELFSLSLIHI
jgi:hypothetical protein